MAETESNNKAKEKEQIMRRFSAYFVFFMFLIMIVVIRIVWLNVVDGSELRALKRSSKRDSLVMCAQRGNIYDCNGSLLASTLPTYKLHMDFAADGMTNELYNEKADSLAICLAKFYGKSASEMKRRLDAGRRRRERWCKIDDRELSYLEKKEVEKFPLFNLGKNKSGINWEERLKRAKPFGMLASRSIGQIYASKNEGYCGIEKKMNEILSGKDGLATLEKMAGRFIKVPMDGMEPIDGKDVRSTIDIGIQDIVENALENQLKDFDAERGCAVVMEVKTGKIKAIANLSRIDAMQPYYTEVENMAVNSKNEPGSTFKTASLIVALETGRLDTSMIFDTGYGEWRPFSNDNDAVVRDHNAKYDSKGNLTREGGYGKISLAQAMWYSSNIGIAKMVDTLFHKKQKDFINRLYDMKLNEPMDLDIPGAASPDIKNPDSNDWSGASMLWMSFGYEMTMPPIYTLTFYNGIANGGKMIKPYLVQSICDNNKDLKTFGTETINPKLCSNSTLGKVRKILEDVVDKGTGRSFKSDKIKFAGKTGTAQTNYWGKDKMRKSHQYSFCGYFPAEDPRYSCITVVLHPRNMHGNPAGMTFKDIAEKINARYLDSKKIDYGEEAATGKIPASHDGNVKATITVLDKLDIDYVKSGNTKSKWANNSASPETKSVNIRGRDIGMNMVPNVVGMGAKDATYLLESRGLNVKISGQGTVYRQSLSAYGGFKRGDWIEIQLK